MKISLKAKVICKDGEFGSVKELLIDPLKESVTHVVIENKHNGMQVVVPVEILDYTTDSVITIEKEALELNEYPPFILHEFVKVPASNTEYAYWGADPTMTHGYTMFPYVLHDGYPVVETIKEAIPLGELKIKKGMVVKDEAKKTLGHVDEMVIDSSNEFITHIIMRTGHLFGIKEVAVPNINISSFDSDAIILNIGEKEIKNLPEVVVKRMWK